jgi:hypothetical protein
MANHVNFFSTNLTSNTLAGATTTHLNSIPTCDAPFYLTLDATGLNSHTEVIYVTSKTATNVNHTATSYDHTTGEEVRMDVVAKELDVLYNSPEGHLLNGKIVPSVASNNLTVALKGKDGNDPSATNPVYVIINGTLRTITAALGNTVSAGTNHANAGSTELATKEIDWFVYLLYNTIENAVTMGFSRIPSIVLVSDGSETDTNEKAFYQSHSSNSTDVCVNIGRFAATLSAGAGYTWSVPTFTAINLVQRPIYETRLLSSNSVCTASSGSPTTVTTIMNYQIYGKKINIGFNTTVTNKGTASGAMYLTAPFAQANPYFAGGCVEKANTGLGGFVIQGSSSSIIRPNRYDNATYLANDNVINGSVEYDI